MIYYEVWGHDTFACEDYLCGRYTSYAEAQRVLKKQETEAKKSQNEGLRDTFCITTRTENDIELQEEKERNIQYARAEEQSYNEMHLVKCTHNLLEKFNEALENMKTEDWQRLQKNHEHLTQEIWWHNHEDCFLQILFESFYSNGIISVSMGISVKEGQYSQGGKITLSSVIRDTLVHLREWSQKPQAIEECVKKFKELILSIYKD